MRQALEQRGSNCSFGNPLHAGAPRVGTVVFLGLGINYFLQIIVFIVTIESLASIRKTFWP